MSKYKISELFSEVLIDDGVLLLSESSADFYYLGEFETKLWQIIRANLNDYTTIVEYLSQSCVDFNLDEFIDFWNDLVHNKIIVLEDV